MYKPQQTLFCISIHFSIYITGVICYTFQSFTLLHYYHIHTTTKNHLIIVHSVTKMKAIKEYARKGIKGILNVCEYHACLKQTDELSVISVFSMA